jgi:hypothetical protein
MTSQFRNRLLVAVCASTLLLVGFWAGWLASRRIVISPLETDVRGSLIARGDACEIMRAGVLRTLRAFQDGYTKRDVNDIGEFMQRHFRPGEHDMVLGTESGEWIRGYDQITKFIHNDWREWGDVQLEVDAAVISAAGDVAWLAAPGGVIFQGKRRPLRFTAALVRYGERWVFRQVQFQWENDVPSLHEILKPANLSRLRWR